MALIQKTITYPEKELQEALDKISQRLAALEFFEDDVRDVMDFMLEGEHYEALNEALDRLNKRSSYGGS